MIHFVLKWYLVYQSFNKHRAFSVCQQLQIEWTKKQNSKRQTNDIGADRWGQGQGDVPGLDNWLVMLLTQCKSAGGEDLI